MSEIDRRQLREFLKVLEGKRQTQEITLRDSQVYLMLRWSSASRSMPKGGNMHTVDVVQIGWAPHIFGETPLSERPKRGATFVWDMVEEFAFSRKPKRAARVESILTAELLRFLKTERGYVEMAHDPHSLVKLPSVDAECDNCSNQVSRSDVGSCICSGCYRAVYCDDDCAREHWTRQHSRNCARLDRVT